MAVPNPSLCPRPRGWLDPDELLQKFLAAFGMERARSALPRPPTEQNSEFDVEWTRIKKLALNGLCDEAEYLKRYRSEIVSVTDVLAVLLDNVRTMLEMVSGREHDALKRAIVSLWNDTIAFRRIVSLPPLCEICGLPVLARRTSKKDGEVMIVTVCSDGCQNARTQRRKRETARKG